MLKETFIAPEFRRGAEGRDLGIDWAVPDLRPGVLGAWDRLVGPGYNSVELRLWLFVTGAGSALAVAYPLYLGAPWSWWKYLLASIIAADIWGGVAVNASAPAKRWRHRPNAAAWHHVMFVVAHGIHVGVVAMIFHAKSWIYFTTFAGALAICTAAILMAPVYLRRPIAAVCAAAGLGVLAAGTGFTPFMEWFEPAMFMKLVVGYLLLEAPFRPPHAKAGT